MDKTMKSTTDGIVLIIMGFGYGFLAAWALFYEWGSAPTAKPVDLPAWTQALGSIIALAVAIAVPHRLYRKERDERSAQAGVERQERAQLSRLQAKASAATMLPIARQFLGGLQSALSQMTDGDIEEYNDVHEQPLSGRLDEFRSCAGQLATMGETGEIAINAIASAEKFLRHLGDWQFYERYTVNGVIEDVGRHYYHEIEEPLPLMPILELGIDRMDTFLSKVDLMFD